MTIHTQITQHLAALGWTPYRLAKESKVGQDTVRRFINGTHDTTTRNADAMLKAMNKQ